MVKDTTIFFYTMKKFIIYLFVRLPFWGDRHKPLYIELQDE